MTTIALANCSKYDYIAEGDKPYLAALEQRGVTVDVAPWNGPVTPFLRADAVVLRSTWDYHYSPDAYRRWLRSLTAAGVPVFNPPPLVEWNLHKSYLLALERAGIAIPRTRIVPPHTADVRTAMAALNLETAFIKPVYGASSDFVRQVSVDSLDAALSGLWEDQPGRDVLVQEPLPEVITSGELSFVFINGEFGHALLKEAVNGQAATGIRLTYTADPALISQAGRVLAALHRMSRALPLPPLYARVDGINRNGQFILMELELNEPNLRLQDAPETAARFADATLAALKTASL